MNAARAVAPGIATESRARWRDESSREPGKHRSTRESTPGRREHPRRPATNVRRCDPISAAALAAYSLITAARMRAGRRDRRAPFSRPGSSRCGARRGGATSTSATVAITAQIPPAYAGRACATSDAIRASCRSHPRPKRGRPSGIPPDCRHKYPSPFRTELLKGQTILLDISSHISRSSGRSSPSSR